MPKTLVTVDRLLHHAHLVLTKGDSHRLAEALAGDGPSELLGALREKYPTGTLAILVGVWAKGG